MSDNKFVRWDEDTDPPQEQCQGTVASGQCPYKKEPGIDYCPRCKGAISGHQKRAAVRNYQLTKFQAKMEQKADSSAVKSLREEIGILRMTLETVINRCQDESELLMSSNKIENLVVKIEKLVTSCHRLEKSSNFLIDKTTILKLATAIIDIVTEEVNDADAVDKIGSRIIEEVLASENIDE